MYKRQLRDHPETNFFHFNVDLAQGPCVIKRLRGCGAGCEYVAITPEGDIYPCHRFVGNEDYKLGSCLLYTSPSGYIVADETTRTSVPGVFAVGDARTKAVRQIVTAVADGAVAAHYAEEFLLEDAVKDKNLS